MNEKSRSILKVVIPLIIALVSVLVLAKIAGSPATYSKTVESLDSKKTTVMELTAAATVASAGITMIPGDVATPLADELAELTSSFMIVLSAIYLEKYLLTILGYLTFGILIPAACVLKAASSFFVNNVFKNIIRKLVITGLVLICVIPISEKVSGLIQNTYDSSIQETIDIATQEVEITEDEDGGLTAIFSKVKDGVTKTTETVEHVLSNFIEALAIMIVTSCVIPVLVLVFFVWFIRFMLGVNINLPKREDLVVARNKRKRLNKLEKEIKDVEKLTGTEE